MSGYGSGNYGQFGYGDGNNAPQEGTALPLGVSSLVSSATISAQVAADVAGDSTVFVDPTKTVLILGVEADLAGVSTLVSDGDLFAFASADLEGSSRIFIDPSKEILRSPPGPKEALPPAVQLRTALPTPQNFVLGAVLPPRDTHKGGIPNKG